MDEAIGRVQFGCQRNFLNPIISKLDKHVVLLLINYIASEEIQLRKENYGNLSSKRLASLRWSFHSLKTFSHVFVLLAVFEFSFLLLRVLISSSCNHGNLSFVLELLKMEKFGKFSSLNSSMLSTTMATCAAFSADVCSLLIGWFRNPLFFLRFHWPKQTVLFFPK